MKFLSVIPLLVLFLFCGCGESRSEHAACLVPPKVRVGVSEKLNQNVDEVQGYNIYIFVYASGGSALVSGDTRISTEFVDGQGAIIAKKEQALVSPIAPKHMAPPKFLWLTPAIQHANDAFVFDARKMAMSVFGVESGSSLSVDKIRVVIRASVVDINGVVDFVHGELWSMDFKSGSARYVSD